ncbi:MAG: glycosyl hydrolase family protein [Solirubrobacteraceae bacterium]
MLIDTLRRRTTILVVAVIICALFAAAGDAVRAATGPPPVTVQVRLAGPAVPVPQSFLGLSMEYTGVASYEKLGPLFDRVVAMIRPQDGSRMLLRLGGKSADHAYWDTPTTGAPRSVFELDDQWMSALSALVARDRLRVMLDLNLGVHSSTMAVNFARAANKALPRSTLAGVEIGNEPDLYHFQGDLNKERIASTPKSLPANWERGYSAADYRRDWISYATALKAALPWLPIGGPETISDKPQWLSAIEGLGRLDPQFLTIHRYASSNCWPSSSPFYPTIALMLSPAASAGLAGTVRGAVIYAHAKHQALRLTEVNSVSCGGNTGVADSFATALWAPDALFQMISEGVGGVSWHIRTSAVNAPFVPSRLGIVARPELYGLALFAQMTGPNARLLGTKVTTTGPANLSVWPVRSAHGLKVLVINKSPRAANVRLALGTGSPRAFVRRLLAPGITTSTGVTFAGQSIGPNAEWQGKQRVTTVSGRSGSFTVPMPGYSAALVTF